MFKKLLVLAILIGLAYFAYSAFFSNSFEKGVAELRDLERKNNAQEAFLVPITEKELGAYLRGISSLKKKYSSNPAFLSALEIKANLALTEQNLLLISKEFSTSDKQNPNCSADAGIGKAQSITYESLQKTDEIVNKRNTFLQRYKREAVLVPEISQIKFEQAIFALKNGLAQIQKILDSYC